MVQNSRAFATSNETTPRLKTSKPTDNSILTRPIAPGLYPGLCLSVCDSQSASVDVVGHSAFNCALRSYDQPGMCALSTMALRRCSASSSSFLLTRSRRAHDSRSHIDFLSHDLWHLSATIRGLEPTFNFCIHFTIQITGTRSLHRPRLAHTHIGSNFGSAFGGSPVPTPHSFRRQWRATNLSPKKALATPTCVCGHACRACMWCGRTLMGVHLHAKRACVRVYP